MTLNSKRPKYSIMINLAEVNYKVLSDDDTDEPGDKFEYSLSNYTNLQNGRMWHVTVTRLVETLYEAKLLYKLRIIWRGKGDHTDLEYEQSLKPAMSMIADRSSHILSTLSFDSYMNPFITPPFFDDVSEEDED